MTEDQKYQGALYKEKNKKPKAQPAEETPAKGDQKKAMSQQAYVEDAGEEGDYENWADYDGPTDDERSPAEPPPEAPTPPSAVPDVNVFDFLVASGQTPNASKLELTEKTIDGDNTSLVRYEYNVDEYLDMHEDVEYGNGPVPTGAFVTPAAKVERRKTKDSETKKDKKRKRLHVEVPGDHIMLDAPPVLHSGLTGGLKGLLRSGLPPSPDYSGGDGADASPASPLKKTKHSKHHRERTGNSLLGMIAGTKSKSSKKRKTSSSKKHSSRREEKMIEYKDRKGENGEGQVILYRPRADLFLGFVDKGPESERGCSMNKALKRFHRERKASSDCTSKGEEEKELWRSLRLRQNDRGEIVLFTI